MKITLKVMLLSLVAMFMVVSVNAQKKQKKQKISIEDRTMNEAKMIAESMELNEDEITIVYETNLKAYKALAQVKAENKERKEAGEEVDKEEMKAKNKEIWKAANMQLKEAFGKEKFKTYQATRKDVKATLKAQKKK